VSFFFTPFCIVQSTPVAGAAPSRCLILKLIGPCFWRMTLQRWRGKSPLAIESIDDRYCRSPRGVMP
jgi:hypothetical protein